MKPALFLATALALAAAPALTQTSEPAPAPSDYRQFNSFDNSPYVGTEGVRHCIAGGAVLSANRGGARTVYVQSKQGRILRLNLAEACDALESAQQVSLRAGGLEVCAGGPAVMKVNTAAGVRYCAIKEVINPTKAEIGKLASVRR
jgi:hypothetical protein